MWHITFNAWTFQTSPSQITAHPYHHSKIGSTYTCFTYIWLVSEIWRTGRYIIFAATNRNKPKPKCCWNVSILWTGNRQHNFRYIEQYPIRTVLCNQKYFKKVAKLFNYLATNPNLSIQYHASGMILYTHSNAYYLSIKKSISQAGSVNFLSDSKPESKYYKPFYHPWTESSMWYIKSFKISWHQL